MFLLVVYVGMRCRTSLNAHLNPKEDVVEVGADVNNNGGGVVNNMVNNNEGEVMNDVVRDFSLARYY